MIQIGIFGALGRMGREIALCLENDSEAKIGFKFDKNFGDLSGNLQILNENLSPNSQNFNPNSSQNLQDLSLNSSQNSQDLNSNLNSNSMQNQNSNSAQSQNSHSQDFNANLSSSSNSNQNSTQNLNLNPNLQDLGSNLQNLGLNSTQKTDPQTTSAMGHGRIMDDELSKIHALRDVDCHDSLCESRNDAAILSSNLNPNSNQNSTQNLDLNPNLQSLSSNSSQNSQNSNLNSTQSLNLQDLNLNSMQKTDLQTNSVNLGEKSSQSLNSQDSSSNLKQDLNQNPNQNYSQNSTRNLHNSQNSHNYQNPQNPQNSALCGSDFKALFENSAVIIDFSSPKGTKSLLEFAANSPKPLVIGTTGLDDATNALMHELSAKMPIFYATNMSLGVALLNRLVFEAASILKGFDIEILEMHHRHKKDAPSGTAMSLAQNAAKARNLELSKVRVSGRDGIVGQRSENEIAVMSLRGGDIVGRHVVGFYEDGEFLELAHTATSRATFAKGAVKIAKWLVSREAGLYAMSDFLGL